MFIFPIQVFGSALTGVPLGPSSIINPTNSPGTFGQVLTSIGNGSYYFGASGSGSQTPWLQNENASSFGLTNLNWLELVGSGGVIGSAQAGTLFGVTNASGQNTFSISTNGTINGGTNGQYSIDISGNFNSIGGYTGTNNNLWATRLLSFATNLPTTGNGTVTWDVTKPVNFLETNANITINLTGLPTTNDLFSTLSISNSDTVNHLITLGGFCAFTNGSGVATSTFYMTNLDAKHQNVEIAIHIKVDRSWLYTNAIVTAFYDK